MKHPASRIVLFCRISPVFFVVMDRLAHPAAHRRAQTEAPVHKPVPVPRAVAAGLHFILLIVRAPLAQLLLLVQMAQITRIIRIAPVAATPSEALLPVSIFAEILFPNAKKNVMTGISTMEMAALPRAFWKEGNVAIISFSPYAEKPVSRRLQILLLTVKIAALHPLQHLKSHRYVVIINVKA